MEPLDKGSSVQGQGTGRFILLCFKGSACLWRLENNFVASVGFQKLKHHVCTARTFACGASLAALKGRTDFLFLFFPKYSFYLSCSCGGH